MRIRPFSTPGRFWRGNLHAHSNLSDGALNPVEVVEAYKRAGYDFLQVSDHFLGRFDWPIADTRALRFHPRCYYREATTRHLGLILR